MSQPAIKNGLLQLLRYDRYLLDLDVNERSITHRLGMYYQLLFPDWDVDCEYNKNLDGPKEIKIDPRAFLDKMADILNINEVQVDDTTLLAKLRHEDVTAQDIRTLQTQLREPDRLRYDAELDAAYFVLSLKGKKELIKRIYPDIIIHRRGTRINNIVIEAKKSSNSNGVSRAYDLVKLVTLVSGEAYKYRRGFFINIPTDQKVEDHTQFVFRRLALDRRVSVIDSV